MKKLVLIAIASIFVCKSISAQINAFSKPPVNILSPDAANLGKYGAYEVNHYSGTPNISIPVYSIKEPGIEVPISISYDASGFMPNKNSSQVGQNWNITAGGAITRIVKGVPDDKHDFTPDNFWEYTKNNKGYIYGIQNNSPSTFPSQSYVQNLTFISSTIINDLGYPAVNIGETGVVYEYNPDIFSFNFLGHSGTFVMGNDGIVKVSSDRTYKVDLSNIGEQDDLASRLSSLTSIAQLNTEIISSIVITSDDGYKFYFGGVVPTLEMSFQYTTNNQIVNGGGTINAWYITKATTPDGKDVFFNYKTYNEDDYIVLKNLGNLSGNSISRKTDFTDERLFISDYKKMYHLYNNGPGNNSNMELGRSLIKMVYLKSIETNLQIASFIYSPKNENHITNVNNVYGANNSYGNNLNRRTSKLDKITISDKAGAIAPFINEGDYQPAPILNFDFVYQYFGDPNLGSRLYLTELKYNDSKHTFDYSRVSELPHPLTTGIDKWGYYNGQNNSKLIGIINPGSPDPGEFETDFTTAGQNRLTDPTKVDIGMLKKITYPTGGNTEFQFEAHSYKKILKRKVNAPVNSLIPVLETLPQEQYAGGCRIKKIINTPGVTTEYKYVKNYQLNSNNSSSGLLTDNGVFRMRMQRPVSVYYQEELFDDNITKNSGFSESHISYPEVVEIQDNGSSGFTKYTYTNSDDQDYPANVACPDNYFLGAGTTRISTFPAITSLENQMKRLARNSSRSTERGKLSKRETFLQGATVPNSSIEYKYNTDPVRFNEKTVGYETIYTTTYADETWGNGFANFIQSFQIYNYHNNPSQIIEKTTENGQDLINTTNFTYKSNSNPLLTEKVTIKSDGSLLKTQYFYPEDKIGNPDFPSSAAMVTRNMVATVVEEKTFKNNIPLITQQFLYGDATGNGGYKLFNTKTLNHTIAGSINNIDISMNYYTDAMVKDFYKRNDYRTAYIWDYKKTLPIAEVKNVANASQIAYTSFETNETWSTGGYNQWNYNVTGCVATNPAPTGGKSFDLSTGGNITRTLDPGVNYVVTVWFNGSNINVNGLVPINGETINQWTLKEYKITGASNITISGVGKIDELRLYPEKALMTTYCYQPFNGIISSADANNKITHYSYDYSRRLTGVWDKNLKILKRICYNYSGQIENCIPDCPPNSPADWQNTSTPLTCQQNSCGYTGYQIREQMDMSTCSDTRGSIRYVEIYNPTACTPAVGGNITYQNSSGLTDYTATYTNRTTGQIYTFNVPSSPSTGNLGCIPPDTYNLSISRSTSPYYLTFGTGCFTQSGLSALFGRVSVPACSSVILEP